MTTPAKSNGPEGTIPVEHGIELTANWREYLAASEPDFVARSFFIPIINFVNILKHNPHAEGVRAYIGLADAADPMSAQLVLVPVVNDQDVVYLPSENGEGNNVGSNVWDLTKVCPPICPLPSVLNQ
jgi:hypothetical protein